MLRKLVVLAGGMPRLSPCITLTPDAALRDISHPCIRPVSGLASAGLPLWEGPEACDAFPDLYGPSGCVVTRSSLTVAGAAPESPASCTFAHVQTLTHRLPVEPTAASAAAGTWCKLGHPNPLSFHGS